MMKFLNDVNPLKVLHKYFEIITPLLNLSLDYVNMVYIPQFCKYFGKLT
jgi:hypothetical protein